MMRLVALALMLACGAAGAQTPDLTSYPIPPHQCAALAPVAAMIVANRDSRDAQMFYNAIHFMDAPDDEKNSLRRIVAWAYSAPKNNFATACSKGEI